MRSYLARAAYAVARVFGADEVIERGARMPANLGGRVLPDLALWFQFQRVGGSLSPQQVSEIIRTADSGDPRRLMDLANEARQKDGHLQGILAQSEETIAELDWTLTLPDTAKARDKKAAKIVEEALRACTGSVDGQRDGFADLIAHLAGAVYYGHAVAEIQWKKNAQKFLIPGSFELHAPRRFGYRQTDGKFIWRDETMPWAGVDFRGENPNKFVVSQPRVTGDVPCREGLVRVLMWASLFRSWSITDWLRTAELAWKPWRIGYYDKGASDEDIEGIRTVLENLVSTGTALLAKTTEFKVEWPGGAGQSSKPTHSEIFNVIAQEMSKAVLGATETVQSSASSGYAQAKVHSEVSKTLIRARARHIAQVIMRDVIRPMIELNFGKGIVLPTFSFVIEDPVDIEAFGNGVDKLVGSGLELGQDYVRKTIGAPAPKPGEKLLAKPLPPAPTPPGGGDGDGENDNGDAPKKPNDGSGGANTKPKPGAAEENAKPKKAA